ncbi:MAG: phytanoyl-CoA dioxygenase [Gemmatimonadetes bacterium]|nr:phytanoyl-CoA dioxygenase [Gemmatimonadota bacterium]
MTMISSLLGLFEETHHSHFDEHGYVVLGRLLSGGELSDLRRRTDDLMMGRVTIPGVAFQLDGKGDNYGKLEKRTFGPSEHTLDYRRIDELHNDPLYLSYMQHPVFRQLTRRYIGEDVSIFRSMFMNKPASGGTELPWHQDVGEGWGLDTTPATTVWTALDDATVESGCMQIAPGSHKLGILNARHFVSEKDQAKYCTPDKVIDLEVEAGEAVLIHNLTIHRSGLNTTDEPRRALSVAYMDAATRNTRNGDPFPIIFGKDALRPPVE